MNKHRALVFLFLCTLFATPPFLVACSDSDDGASVVIRYSAVKDAEKAATSTAYRLSKVDSITFYSDKTFRYVPPATTGDSQKTIAIAKSPESAGKLVDSTLILPPNGLSATLILSVNDITIDKAIVYTVTRDDGISLPVATDPSSDACTITLGADAASSSALYTTYTISATCINDSSITINDATFYVTAHGGKPFPKKSTVFTGVYTGNPKVAGTVSLTGHFRDLSFTQDVTIQGCRLLMSRPLSSRASSETCDTDPITLFKNGVRTYVISFNLNGGNIPGRTAESSALKCIECKAQSNSPRAVVAISATIIQKDGYVFCGWTESASTEGARTTQARSVSTPVIIAPGSYYTFCATRDIVLTAVFKESAPLSVALNGVTTTLTDAALKSFTYTAASAASTVATYTFSGTISATQFNRLMFLTKSATGPVALDFSSCDGAPFSALSGTRSYTLCGVLSPTDSNPNITSVTLPANLSSIPSYAFYNCTALAACPVDGRTVASGAFLGTPLSRVIE